MPRGDGTGPMGNGPMTGRGAGFCAGFAVPGVASALGRFGGFGGFGCRRGAGGGMRGAGMQARNRFMAQPFMAQPYGEVGVTTANEKEWLSRQMNALETQLQQVKQRLGKMVVDSE